MITNKNFNLDLKTIVIIALLIFIGYHRFLKPVEVTKEVTQTESVDIKKVVEEAINNRLQLQTPQLQPTIIYQDRIVPINNISEVPKADLKKLKNLNKYKDTTKLENATIYSEILSDGTVYSNKVVAEIDVKTITKTKETVITRKESGMFIGPSVQFNQFGINQFGLQLDYIRKNDVGAGVGAFLDNQTGQLNWRLTLRKKIF